jgi:hypothetical protein
MHTYIHTYIPCSSANGRYDYSMISLSVRWACCLVVPSCVYVTERMDNFGCSWHGMACHGIVGAVVYDSYEWILSKLGVCLPTDLFSRN